MKLFQVNGKSFKKFREIQSKILQTWILPIENELNRVVLEKDTLDIYVNGDKVEAEVSLL